MWTVSFNPPQAVGRSTVVTISGRETQTRKGVNPRLVCSRNVGLSRGHPPSCVWCGSQEHKPRSPGTALRASWGVCLRDLLTICTCGGSSFSKMGFFLKGFSFSGWVLRVLRVFCAPVLHRGVPSLRASSRSPAWLIAEWESRSYALFNASAY